MKLSNISKPTLILVLVVAILSGLFGATAATTIYNSSLVSYNNAASGMQSNNVQDAVDELYHAATDYTGFDNRITKLESYAQDNPTSYFREYGIELNRANGSTTTGGYIDFHWQGDTSDYTSRIIENGNGNINIVAANGLTANGQSVLTAGTKEVFSGTIKDSTLGYTIGENHCASVGKLVTCSFRINGLTTTNFPAGSEKIFITMPSNKRPSYNVFFDFAGLGSGFSENHYTYGYIATNGNLVLYHSSGTINQAFMNVTYVI